MRKRGETLDELQWDYNREQVADAASLIMDNLSGLGDWLVNGKSARAYGTTQDDFKPYKVEIPEENLTPNQTPKTTSKKAEQARANYKLGKDTEVLITTEMQQEGNYCEREITVRVPSGRKSRLDIVSMAPDDTVSVTEVKGSLRTWLNENQQEFLPELVKHGGVVVGKGKGLFSGGYVIKPGVDVKVVQVDMKGDGRRVYTGIK